MKDRGYRAKDISRLFGFTERQIKAWHRSGLVPHVFMEEEEPVFGFRELVCFKAMKDLLDKGITPRRMKTYLDQLKRILPESDRLLTELKFSIHGRKLLARKNGQTFDSRGQLHLDFSLRKPRAVVFIDLGKRKFLRGSEYPSHTDPEVALADYRSLLEYEPRNADAMVNLGNIYYGMGNTEGARHWYLEALMIEPDHVEGNYNYANLLDERGEIEPAIVFYLNSINSDTAFADAHFNVAICFHKLGKFEEAKRYFSSYLKYDSTSEWAKIAMELLNSY